MPDPVVRGPAAAWPPSHSQGFVEKARSLLDVRPVLVIIGPAGAGRRRLAAGVAELAAADGAASLRHAPRHSERDRPYFALSQLFPTLSLSPDAPSSGVEVAVRAALDQIAGGPPVLLLTETDLCDPQSVEILTQVAGTGDIRVIATLSPETVPDQRVLLSAGEVIDLPRLDEDQIGALLRIRFGVRPHPLLVSQLLECTDGSYAAVRDVTDASVAAGLILVIEDILVPHPATTTDNLTSLRSPWSADRLGGDEEITALVQLTSLLGQLDVDEARTCLSSPTVDLALKHGAFAQRDGSLFLASKPESMLVLRTLTERRRRELLDRFATQLPCTLARPGVAARAADWWIAARRPLPIDLATRAAREANLSGRHYRAAIYTDPANNEQLASIAPLERAFAFGELNANADLSALFAELDPATLTEDELLVYLRGLARLERREDHDDLVEQAVAAADPESRRRRVAVRTLAELVDLAFEAAGDEVINRLRSLAFSAPLSPGNRAVTFATMSAVLRHSGRPLQAVEAAEFALEILTEEGDHVSPFHLSLTRELHIMALISAIDPDGAESAIGAYMSGRYAHPSRSPMTMALETSLAMLQGDLERALASARLCLAGLHPGDPHQLRGWVEAMLTQILVLNHRNDEARSILYMAEGRPASRRQLDLERRMMLAWTHDALADPEEALRLLSDAADEARAHGLRLALIDAAALSVQIGGPPHLPMLLGTVDDLVDATGVPLIWQAFARGAHKGDLRSLAELAELAHNSRACRLAAEVAQYVLDMARRDTDLEPETRTRLQQLTDPSSTRQIYLIS